MNHIKFFESINIELISLKDKVRNLLNNVHWLTDGELKESILRNIIRRHMPKNIEVGRGFIMNDNNCSNQIDILLFDKSYPILFRDGDLVFVTPDAVKGIVEVKTTASSGNVLKAFRNLTYNTQFVQSTNCFIGFFAYESELNSQSVLNHLHNFAEEDRQKVINHICIGPNDFYKFWDSDPSNNQNEFNRWNYYTFPEDIAPAFFINNMLDWCSNGKVSNNSSIWFRIDPQNRARTKETYMSDYKQLKNE
ncbi:DUF6602 domain-containing protein [Pseudalkalibacillus sp. A8]|uniref:DUF6602 domain-containing protein n=1 Tax=Pseudalkalibacillus sp. A8 TaxID=3382641 RepID=UPI0038B4E504